MQGNFYEPSGKEREWEKEKDRVYLCTFGTLRNIVKVRHSHAGETSMNHQVERESGGERKIEGVGGRLVS